MTNTGCAIDKCSRKASAYRIIVNGEIAYICSRHAAIAKHAKAEADR